MEGELQARRSMAGFSLLEAIIATGLMAAALASLGQMFAISVANNRSARAGSYATVLALQKMEQLRGLAWGFDASGTPLTDRSTNTAAAIEASSQGTGLSPSPAGTLNTRTAGWVDYVDSAGNILGGGTAIPANTVYIRRWAIEPMPSDPGNTIAIHVLVTMRATRGVADAAGSTARLPDEARLVSVRTRKRR